MCVVPKERGMENYCLKWNEFQEAVTDSFKVLRKEDNLNDITLVSDEGQHVQAHRVVLSATCGFFRNVFKKVAGGSSYHHPLIYMSGVSFTNLNYIIDYLYNGELEVNQDDVEAFVNVAQQLRIDSFKLETNDQDPLQTQVLASPIQRLRNGKTKEAGLEVEEEYNVDTRTYKKEPFMSSNFSNGEKQKTVSALITKVGNLWSCKNCGKTSEKYSVISNHVEVHIEGIFYNCFSCHRTFKTSGSLSGHVVHCLKKTRK